jgi:hypothetical protein
LVILQIWRSWATGKSCSFEQKLKVSISLTFYA